MNTKLINSTFDEQPMSVKHAIILLVNVMKVDYAAQFIKIYTDDFTVGILKNRLLERFKGQNPISILRGYETAASNSPKFMPTVQELIEAIEMAEKELKRIEKNRLEAEHLSSLPPPTITCNPMQMLRDALKNPKPTRTEMDEMIRKHEALLASHANKIAHGPVPSGDQQCKYPGCYKPGTISHSTSGGGNFYCAAHRMTA